MADYLRGIQIVEVDTGGRVITTPSTSVIGIVGTAPSATAKYPVNTPVLITSVQDLKDMGEVGTLPMALRGIYNQASPLCVVVRIEDGADINATIAAAAGNEVASTGVFALLKAEGNLTLKPKILLCPYLTSKMLADHKPNAIVTNLLSVADKLRAVAVIDGPNTTKEEAIAFAGNISSSRAYIIDPAYIPSFVSPSPNPKALSSSSLAAGVIAKTDAEKGFWYSPSNTEVRGVVKLNRFIDFNVSNPNTESTLLNKAGVATLIFTAGSYRLWGNRSPSKDNKWQFISVRRTCDTVYDAIESNMLWAMDKPFSKQLISDIESNVNLYLSTLKAQGALLGASVSIDKSANSIDRLINGELTIDFDLEPPVPVEGLKFRAYRNQGYYNEVFK